MGQTAAQFHADVAVRVARDHAEPAAGAIVGHHELPLIPFEIQRSQRRAKTDCPGSSSNGSLHHAILKRQRPEYSGFESRKRLRPVRATMMPVCSSAAKYCAGSAAVGLVKRIRNHHDLEIRAQMFARQYVLGDLARQRGLIEQNHLFGSIDRRELARQNFPALRKNCR